MNASDLPVYPEEAHQNIALALILSVVTFGIYFLVWKHKQFTTINLCLGRKQFSVISYVFLSLVTLFLFSFYQDYQTAVAIKKIQREYDFPVSRDLPLISLLCSIFFLHSITAAIQQSAINDLVADYDDAEF